ncbi:hypothetical protein YC2023_091916 [Brassica napus]
MNFCSGPVLNLYLRDHAANEFYRKFTDSLQTPTDRRYTIPFYSLCNSLSSPTISQLLVSEATLDFTSACQYLTIISNTHVDAHIYRWRWDTKIVISDVDVTITKSDVLGQFMPLVGRDWTQSGVAKLFSAIKEKGYQLLFLSARAIVHAYLTRSFLNNLKQVRLDIFFTIELVLESILINIITLV